VLIADMPAYNGRDRKDVLVRQIREAIAEENRKEIIERLWKGRQERVRRGLFPGGNVPYGFRRVGKTLEVEPAEAEIVRRIFALAEVGRGPTAVARVLNADRLARRNHQPWTQRQVATSLARRNFYRGGLIRYGVVVGTNEDLVLVASRHAESR
jgi:DNA invertase Pin-like site-specific DNA recombinase